MRPITFRHLIGSAALATCLALAGCGDDSDSGGDAAAQGDGSTCDNWKLGVVDADDRRSAWYAVDHDLVDTSAFPGLEVSYLALPALIQATGTDQFNTVEGSLVGVASAKTQGVDMRIIALAVGFTGTTDVSQTLGIFVRDDSDIDSPEDLDGKTLGVQSFGATGTLVEQAVLQETYGLNTSLQGGDVKFAQLDPATLVSALDRGQVDAVSGVGLAAFNMGAEGSGFRQLTNDNVEWNDLTGHNVVGAAYQATAKQVESDPGCYTKLRELMDASTQYAQEHITEIAPDVAAETGVPEDYVLFQWQSGATQYYAGVDQDWVEAAQTLLDTASDLKLIPATLDVESVLVK